MRKQLFNAEEVQMEGTNLIEASAGTGKTYSIAILLLRLILAENLSIRQVLMVTFTKAAVAELEERIRAFVRKAHRAAHGHPIDDSLIARLVAKQIDIENSDIIQQRLQEAVLFLDETAVMTIHGFCQQTLTEFAFETGQVFGAETLQDPAMLLEEQVNKFWRRQVTTLPEPLLEALIAGGLSRTLLINVIKEHLGGKRYFPYEEGKIYDCTGDQHAQWMNELKELREKEQLLTNSLNDYFSNNRERLLQLSDSDGNARKSFLPYIDQPETWLAKLREKRTNKYVIKLFPDIIAMCSDCDDATLELSKQYAKILGHLYCMGIAEVSKAVKDVKERQNLIAFDDMIDKLHAALTRRSNPRLVEALREKYKAVFIDEFQDTDRQQYEIFDTAFGVDTIVFYIGDPKQSIYAWRKADLQTYFRARNSVGNVYEMNTNFRSSTPYISAMNEFFAVDDPFFFQGASDGIEYIDVQAPTDTRKGMLVQRKEAVKPMTITDAANKQELFDALVADVISLLSSPDYAIVAGAERPVRPSDIGILVRTHREGNDIKSMLARYGIPAVTIGDAKILESPEARMVWHFLTAMEEPTKGQINRALISPLTGHNADTVLALKEEVVTDMFRVFRRTWEESGVYTAMMNLVHAFNIRGHLLSANSEEGERSITNLFQLIELIHKVQVRQGFSTLELIAWLQRGIDGMQTEGDEFEQRVESDEECIKIVTIHKSKGLEYNIVLTPSLDQTSDNPKIKTASFRDPNSNEYVSLEKVNLTQAQKQLLEEQESQEKRRMLYVAITRAVYKCFVYKRAAGKSSSKSTLSPFVDNRDFTASHCIEKRPAIDIPEAFRYRSNTVAVPAPIKAPHFRLAQLNWRRVSYSSLAAKHEFRIKPTIGGQLAPYDRFMFYQLAKGAHTGNMLHFIFEQVNFSNDSNWDYIINKAITQFAPNKRDLYAPLLRQMIETIMRVPIDVNGSAFTLSKLENGSRVHEFEFDFTIDHLDPDDLNQLSDERISIAVKDQHQLEGMMNGLIDLLFLHEGKYYILDWKSNFLGDQHDDYQPDQLGEAMNENNYHLQYLLYSVAAKKYLKDRMGAAFDFEAHFGGVIYLFLRGIRVGQANGIFTTMPSSEMLEKVEAILTTKSVLS